MRVALSFLFLCIVWGLVGQKGLSLAKGKTPKRIF